MTEKYILHAYLHKSILKSLLLSKVERRSKSNASYYVGSISSGADVMTECE